MTSGRAQMMRIHLGEDDTWDGEPLYRAILARCRQMGIAGATVYRAVEGYGGGSFIRRPHFLRSRDLPIVITVIDAADKIATLRPALDAMLDEGLVAISSVEIFRPGA